jgi:hypothetical protein
VVSARDARRTALALPEAVEQDHHGFPSFRVAGKIFATLPDVKHLHVMLDADAVDAAVDTAPEACEELWWGKRLAGVRVTLSAVRADLVAGLLSAAWRRKAPRGLVRRYDAPS